MAQPWLALDGALGRQPQGLLLAEGVPPIVCLSQGRRL